VRSVPYKPALLLEVDARLLNRIRILLLQEDELLHSLDIGSQASLLHRFVLNSPCEALFSRKQCDKLRIQIFCGSQQLLLLCGCDGQFGLV